MREENQALQKDLANLRQLYKEAQEDILLLRENIAKQSHLGGSQGGATQDVSARQDLIIQLEEHQEKVSFVTDPGNKSLAGGRYYRQLAGGGAVGDLSGGDTVGG